MFRKIRKKIKSGQERARENRAMAKKFFEWTMDVAKEALKDEDLTPEEHRKKYGW